MKRIFELTTKDMEDINKNTLKEIIEKSEGRTVMSENIISYTPYIREVSNLELSASFGADIQHIGDCGTFGMALPENIMTLSVAIRGIRHTYRRMAQSILR